MVPQLRRIHGRNAKASRTNVGCHEIRADYTLVSTVKSFESKHAYWDFAKTVRAERRFIFDGQSGKFLSAVRIASKSRVRSLKTGTCLYRAQVGSTLAPGDDMGIEEEHPHPKERMVPDPKKT
jgi:hypothetical protein